MNSTISVYTFVSLFVVLSGVLLVGYSAAQLEKLSENGANVCQYDVNNKTQYQCCKGWSQVGDQCTKAICTQPCVNGICTKPDNCTCHPGYQGKQCENISCPPDKWGTHGCTNNCECPKNATCDPQTGICKCPPGWTGKHCEACVYDHYGEKCQYRTECDNGGCPAPGGKCICADGYYGERCKYRCTQGTFGHKCSENCACPNNNHCSHVNGICCQCYNIATCYSNASCDCLPGWTGEKCDISRQSNQSNCSCANQNVNVTTCECRSNNDSSTPKSIANESGSNHNLLPLLILVVPVAVAVAAVSKYYRLRRSRPVLLDKHHGHPDRSIVDGLLKLRERKSETGCAEEPSRTHYLSMRLLIQEMQTAASPEKQTPHL